MIKLAVQLIETVPMVAHLELEAEKKKVFFKLRALM